MSAFQDGLMPLPSCLDSLRGHQHAGQVLQRLKHACLAGHCYSCQADCHGDQEACRLHDKLVMTGATLVFGEERPEQ